MNMVITKETSVGDMLKRAPPCSCTACKHGCKMGSGFLAADDFEPLARAMSVSIAELKKKYLERRMLFNKEAWRPKLIRKKHPTTGKKVPYGACIFYKNGMCSVHDAKPLECKLAMPCKPYGEEQTTWFMLNNLIDFSDDDSVREYASYLKAGGKTLKGGKLEELLPRETLKRILQK